MQFTLAIHDSLWLSRGPQASRPSFTAEGCLSDKQRLFLVRKTRSRSTYTHSPFLSPASTSSSHTLLLTLLAGSVAVSVLLVVKGYVCRC